MEGKRTYRFAVASWLAVAAWAVVIFCMSANTGDALDHGNSFVAHIAQWLKGLQAQVLPAGVDIVNPVAHFCEYTVFGMLLSNAWRTHVPLPWAVWAAVLCGSLYGITDEIHQIFVPGRSSDPLDWLVDTCGAALGAIIALAIVRALARRRARQADGAAGAGGAGGSADDAGAPGIADAPGVADAAGAADASGAVGFAGSPDALGAAGARESAPADGESCSGTADGSPADGGSDEAQSGRNRG